MTGGSSGIGAGVARSLAGAEVVVGDREREGAEVVAKEIDGEAWVVDLCLTERSPTCDSTRTSWSTMRECR